VLAAGAPAVTAPRPTLPPRAAARRGRAATSAAAGAEPSGEGAQFDTDAYNAQCLKLDGQAMAAMAAKCEAESSAEAAAAAAAAASSTVAGTAEQAPPPPPGAWKWEIRKQIWDMMEENDLSDFPRPVHHRIPNFKGAAAAAAQLAGLPEFQAASCVKVNPDTPQKQVCLCVKVWLYGCATGEQDGACMLPLLPLQGCCASHMVHVHSAQLHPMHPMRPPPPPHLAAAGALRCVVQRQDASDAAAPPAHRLLLNPAQGQHPARARGTPAGLHLRCGADERA
jgi:hypothetical protein